MINGYYDHRLNALESILYEDACMHTNIPDYSIVTIEKNIFPINFFVEL